MSQSPIGNAPAGDPPSRESLPRRVVVVIPALNEEATVAQVVRAIPREMPGAVVTDVVVVDDGSTDRTAAVAREAGATVVLHPRNRGSGAAFATGRLKAVDLGADIVCHMDADGQFDPADIPKLIAPILQGDADFVTCTRFARTDFVSRRNKKGHRAGHALGEEVGEPHGDPARELVVRGAVHRHLVRLPRLHARGGPPPPPLQQVRLRARDAHAALARESANRRGALAGPRRAPARPVARRQLGALLRGAMRLDSPHDDARHASHPLSCFAAKRNPSSGRWGRFS